MSKITEVPAQALDVSEHSIFGLISFLSSVLVKDQYRELQFQGFRWEDIHGCPQLVLAVCGGKDSIERYGYLGMVIRANGKFAACAVLTGSDLEGILRA
jgi:hypothetical protein